MCLGHALCGFAGSQIVVLAILEMIEDGSRRYPGNEMLITSMSSGAYRCLIGITQMVRPLYGSTATKYLGF